MAKIDELIKREVSLLIYNLFPGRIISVTAVEVSRDLSFAKIWISTLENPEEAVKACQERAKEMTRALAAKLKTKKVPRLYFVHDKSSENVAKLESLISQIHESDAKNEK